MVRCGHCQGAFNARTEFIPEQPQPELPVADAGHTEETPVSEQSNLASFLGDIADKETESAAIADHYPEEFASHEADEAHEAHEADEADEADKADEADDQSAVTDTDFNLTLAPDHLSHQSEHDAPHDSEPALHHEIEPEFVIVEPLQEHPSILPHEPAAHAGHTPEQTASNEHAMLFEQAIPEQEAYEVPVKRRAWPWVLGIAVSLILLIAQSAYFYRVSLAAQVPALKPALLGVCHLLGCSVPLPRNADMITIESSGLEADPAHENLITLNALLRNRAGYPLSFPALALTLNDTQDKPLTRRWLLPAEYLPSGENELSGFAGNHEVSIKLRLDTADLKPSGYRLELFYPRDRP
jgi:hypothetical protein